MMLVVQSRSGGLPASIAAKMREHGAALEPMHPGTSDPVLASFFFADIDSPETARALASLLISDAAVAAAYVKPPEDLP